jgi:tetratricopeptide (TPR) repeat protein
MRAVGEEQKMEIIRNSNKGRIAVMIRHAVICVLLSYLYTGCFSERKTPDHINLLPMYGRVQKDEELLREDDRFIASCDNKYKNRKEAAAAYVKMGWNCFDVNDFDQAMKRFNQAWLLDSSNADIYWGFGNVLGKQSEFKESLEYFDRSIHLNSNNARVWYGKGLSLGQLFAQSHDVGLLLEAIQCFKVSVAIDPKNAYAYGALTTSYSFFAQQDSALKYLKITDRLDPSVLNPEVRKILKKPIRSK